MNEHIQKIARDSTPECRVLGHRVHVTMNATSENWPSWGRVAYGIAGGFIHFEKDEDYQYWLSLQPPKVVEDTPVVAERDVGGRCVPECGPIGFKSAA